MNNPARSDFVSPRSHIGKNVTIGVCSVVHDNVVIEDNVVIDDHCIIGYPTSRELSDRRLTLGAGSRIRSHTVVYEGSDFRGGLETGHHTLIRENTKAGKKLRVGSFSDIEGDCSFGDYATCHSYVHVGKGSQIGHFVWLYSLVTLTNDPLPPSFIERPVILEDGVVVCVNCTVLPGTMMRKGSYAAAGTLVRGEIPTGAIVSGPDSAVSGHISTLIDSTTLQRHPWMNHYMQRYPAEAHDRIQKLGEEIKTSRFKL